MMPWIDIEEDVPPTNESVLLFFYNDDEDPMISIGWNEAMPDETPQFYVPEIRTWVDAIYWACLPDFPPHTRKQVT